MSLADDLLEQATRLARLGQRNPNPANLRRAVSTAYYAVFHLLTAEAAALLLPSDLRQLEPLVQRGFEHAVMKDVCKSVAAAALPPPLLPHQNGTIEPDLRKVADAFWSLQEARHAADYDTALVLTRQEALARVLEAREAFAAWRRLGMSGNARMFLLALALPALRRRR